MILSGSSNTLNWDNITWTIDASSRVSANVKLQLFNYNSGQYPDNGVGMAATLDGPNTMEQIIPSVLQISATKLADGKLSSPPLHLSPLHSL